MKKVIIPLLSLLFVSFASCNSDDTTANTETPSTVTLPISGKYSWEFEIPGMGTQVSIHDFSNEKIEYIMSGDAYTNTYDMIPESYNSSENRIVAVGKGGEGSFNKEGVYFVLFLKDITNTEVTIYKKECTSKEEAYSFAVPADNDVNNHGWNVYTKQ